MSPDPKQPDDAAPDKDSELLLDGQEEVFSRTEVERGAIEHHSLEEDESSKPRRETKVNTDEAMAENFRSAFNPRP